MSSIATKTFMLILLLSLSVTGHNLYAHCQVPCGIYDDHARYLAMLEDSKTVEKATSQIIVLSDNVDSKRASQSLAHEYNQLVRWIANKESHAEKIILTISSYFLTQRVKPKQEDYADRLKKHHAVILAAMKAKQNASSAASRSLTLAIQDLASYYPEHEH